MKGGVAQRSASGEIVAFRGGSASMAWNNAHVGARVFSAGADPLSLLTGLVLMGDALAMILAAVTAYLVRCGPCEVSLEMSSTALLATALALELMRCSGAYTRHLRSPVSAQIRRVACIWTMVVLLVTGLEALTKSSDLNLRIWAFTWYVGAMSGLAVVRLAAGCLIRRWSRQGRCTRTVAVVDTDSEGWSAAVAQAIIQHGANEVCLAGVFSAKGGRLSGVDDLMRLARLFRIDEVIVTDRGRNHDELTPLLRQLGTLPANISICTAPPWVALPRPEAAFLFGCPVLTVYRRPLTGWRRVVKRVEDSVLASALLVGALPLILILAAAIKLDSSGPVLFRQRRTGFNNNAFEVLKFRTMVHAPDPGAEVHQATRNDPRVTRVGKILRRTSLDELPQLLNVLQGEMSLVGPRPHAVPHNEHFATRIDGYLARHRVQPGITGWAQVNGLRGETETLDKMQRRVEHDLAYIEGWSVWFDLRILLQTVVCIFGRNAY